MMIAQQVPEVPSAVFVIWGVTLAIAILVVLPLTVYLLQRTLNAARRTERYLAEMRDAGVGIAQNTGHISNLDDTIDVATQILDAAASIREHTATIETTLAGRVQSNGEME